MEEKERFLSVFGFDDKRYGYIGIERERFLADASDNPVPRAREFLAEVSGPAWTYELSACQVEDRTVPKLGLEEIYLELEKNDREGIGIAGRLGLNLRSIPVAAENMCLEAYPDPRYQKIAERISLEKLKAACRVAGLHIHIGMSGWAKALLAYNRLRENLDFLCRIGDRSGGERLRLYKVMASNWHPPVIENVEHFLETAEIQGFLSNPRDCYWLVRLSSHGTVELRMFDATENNFEILGLVLAVRLILEGI